MLLHSYTVLRTEQLSQFALRIAHDGPAWPKHVARLFCIANCMLCWSGLRNKVSILSCPRVQQLFRTEACLRTPYKQTWV